MEQYMMYEKAGEEIIAECAVKDRVWGIGLSICPGSKWLAKTGI